MTLPYSKVPPDIIRCQISKTKMIYPLRSSSVTEPSTLLRDNPPLCSVLDTLPLTSFSP